MYARYAVYFVPDGEWGEFGAAWLGWDCRRGAEVELLSPERAALTERPRKYGFHATVRPPFRPADGCTQGRLAEAVQTICADMQPIPLASLQLSRLGSFFALTAPEERAALQTLGDRTVERFNPLRAPLTEAELARRRAGSLSQRQEELLLRWGYPYVREEYRFHLTLTGPVKKPEVIAPELHARLEGPMARPLVVDSLSLLGEDGDGRFHQITRYEF